MQKSWVFSVLIDLQEFANRNGLGQTSVALKEALKIALEESNSLKCLANPSNEEDPMDNSAKGAENLGTDCLDAIFVKLL